MTEEVRGGEQSERGATLLKRLEGERELSDE